MILPKHLKIYIDTVLKTMLDHQNNYVGNSSSTMNIVPKSFDNQFERST